MEPSISTGERLHYTTEDSKVDRFKDLYTNELSNLWQKKGGSWV